MRCCVPYCKNDSRYISKLQGITFHLIPAGPTLRAAWLKALGEVDELKKGAAVCSEHFLCEDLYETRGGLRKVKIGAVPWILQNPVNVCDYGEPASLKCSLCLGYGHSRKYCKITEPTCSHCCGLHMKAKCPKLQACRICLETDKKLYPFNKYNLKQAYEHITGISLQSEYRLPQTVCTECAQTLTNCYSFRERMLRANSLMLQILQKGGELTINYIQTINRKSNQHSSPLSLKNYLPDHFDLQLKEDIEESDADEKIEGVHEDIIVKEEEDYYEIEELDERFSEDFENDEDKNDTKKSHSNECQSENYKSKVKILDLKAPLNPKILDNNDCDHIRDPLFEEEVVLDSVGCSAERIEVQLSIIEEESHDLPPSTDVEVKLEGSNETYIHKFQHFDDDNDKAPSEVYRNKTEVTHKVDNQRKLDNKENPVKSVKRKKSGEDDTPDNIADICKTTKVKRRRQPLALDETLFTISSLSYDQQIQEVLRRKDSSAYTKAPYKCDVCYRGYSAKDLYTAHAIRHSEQNGKYECFICKTRYKTGSDLRKHLKSLHTTQYSCNQCRFVTKIRGVAKEHVTWHAGTKYQCQHCSSEFDKLSTYMGHIRIKHVSDCVCELCGYTFVNSFGVVVHKRRTHRLVDKTVPLEGPYCEVCEVKFASQEAHDRHLKLSSKHISDHDPNRIRNSCQFMNRERRPSVHARVSHSQSEPVTCEQLRNRRMYAQHFKQSHPDKTRAKFPAVKTPCMCEQCGKIFTCISLLLDHMSVHTGEKLYKCAHCSKSFAQKTKLVIHMRLHRSGRPSYGCALCGMQLSSNFSRQRHMLLHTGLKAHKCDICGKSFTTKAEQNLHVQHVHYKVPWPKRNRPRTSKKRDEPTEED